MGAAFALATVLFATAASAQNAVPAPAIPVTVDTAARRDVPVFLTGLGTVQADAAVSLRTRVDGELQQLLFDEGQAVKAGDVLARIDQRPFQAQLAQAQATQRKDEALLANARLDLARQEGLDKTGNATRQALDTARALVGQLEATVESDEAQIDYALLQLNYTEIRSPLDGVTGIRLVDPGNLVRASDAAGLVVVTRVDPISVVFSLPQGSLDMVREAIERHEAIADVSVAGDASPRASGPVKLVDNQVDPATGTVRLKASLPNPEHRLWPGMYVTVKMQARTLQDAVTVPDTVVQRGPSGPYAYVVKDDETVEMRPVTVATTQNGMTVLGTGVAAGERVVVDGQLKLRPGSRVAARAVAAPGLKTAQVQP